MEEIPPGIYDHRERYKDEGSSFGQAKFGESVDEGINTSSSENPKINAQTAGADG